MNPLFSRSKAPPGRASMVKGWITERFGLSAPDLVSIAELACHEPGCPPVETVMTVYAADSQRRTFRLHKPLAQIAAADIAALEAQP